MNGPCTVSFVHISVVTGAKKKNATNPTTTTTIMAFEVRLMSSFFARVLIRLSTKTVSF